MSASFTTTTEGAGSAVIGLGEVLFSIRPGADPSPIQINVLNIGATPFVGPGGIWFGGGSIPGVFIVSAQATQTNGSVATSVTCNLTINPSGTLSIQLPNLNPALTTIVAVTFPDDDLSSSQSQQGFIVSTVVSPSNFGQDGSLPSAFCGNQCTKAAVASLDTNGNPLWVTVFGGSVNDDAAFATATQNGVSVSGVSESPDFPVTSTAPFLALGSSQDAYLANFDASTGQLRNATYLGLPGTGGPVAQIASSAGNIALAGGYTTANGPLGFVVLWQPVQNQFSYRFIAPAPVATLLSTRARTYTSPLFKRRPHPTRSESASSTPQETWQASW